MSISSAARRVSQLLKQLELKVVFAESCTGGLVSGSLTAIPGISNFHCGGVVTYRNATKSAYLDIPKPLLVRPGPVSQIVAQRMAASVLKKTPEADVSISVTGHLGPRAPAELDGQVFISIARRGSKGRRVTTYELNCPQKSRVMRQKWVVEQVLELLCEYLSATGDTW